MASNSKIAVPTLLRSDQKISQKISRQFLEICSFHHQAHVGSEPWKFLVIQNKALRDKLKPLAGACNIN